MARDGMENTSSKFDEEEIAELGQKDNVRIIILASLFSDLSAAKRLAHATGGFFIYRPLAALLVEPSKQVAELLANTRVIEITPERMRGATAVRYSTGKGQDVIMLGQ